MGRRKSRELAVWMNGLRVGRWAVSSAGLHEFTYADEWLGSAAARPISLSMPLRPVGMPYRAGVEAYFSNLLPDNRDILDRIQRRFGAASSGAFDLLSEIGRDCVGALQFLPEGAVPDSLDGINGDRLSSPEVEDYLRTTLSPVMGQDEGDTFRISIAGAQEKTALLWHRNSWYRPKGSTPTTHIIKLPIGVSKAGIDLSTSIENEWLCAQILQSYGLPVAECRMQTFGAFHTLIVTRFDRRRSSKGHILRLPQEDFCQATGLPPSQKYESDGGPGVRAIMDLLRNSNSPAEDRAAFMRAQVVFWMLAAIDGHAKNFSIFLLPKSEYRLTPLYDVMSAFPIVGKGHGKIARQKVAMAMAVWGKSRHYRWTEIRARHFLDTAHSCGLTGMQAIISELVEKAPQVIEQVQSKLPNDFPVPIASAILGGLKDAAKALGEDMTQRKLK